MSVVAAVKKAVECGFGDYWMLDLPEAQKHAYFKGTSELRREEKDEWDDYVTMKVAARALREEGVRGLCF